MYCMPIYSKIEVEEQTLAKYISWFYCGIKDLGFGMPFSTPPVISTFPLLWLKVMSIAMP